MKRFLTTRKEVPAQRSFEEVSSTANTDVEVVEGITGSGAVTVRGMSGKKIAMFVGGGFIAAIIIFYLLGNWDVLGNSGLCWAQNLMGVKTHWHFNLKDGSEYQCGNNGNAADGNV